MPRKKVQCQQPTCGRVTADFYRIDPKVAETLTNVAPGETCVPCYEAIAARLTRGRPAPTRKEFRGETE